jgi:hypothetical protein
MRISNHPGAVRISNHPGAVRISNHPGAVRRRPDRGRCDMCWPASFSAAGKGQRYSSSSEAAR